VLREQALGFRPDWEAVVTPFVDYCETVPEIDASQLALLGASFGGHLAPRAAAFEPRLRAVITIDGLYDGYASVLSLLNPELRALLDAEDADGFNSTARQAMDTNSAFRWYIDQALWAFRVASPFEFFEEARAYRLDGVVDLITCPVLVCAAATDHFNPGQAENLAAALGERATLRPFTDAESAGVHSHPGASVLVNGVVLDWLTATLREQHGGVVMSASRRPRLAQLTRADLSPSQLALYDGMLAKEIPWAEHAGARAIAADGSLLGPFGPLLFSPDIAGAFIDVFRADGRSTTLSPRVHEIVILTVGAACHCEYELYAHRLLGAATGLDDKMIDAIIADERPDFDRADEAAAYDFTLQLVTQQRVGDATYTKAKATLGDQSLLDVVLLIGLYLTVCSILNAFAIEVPD
jgi:alkylhydroperoxidase family enzyme